MNRLNMLANLRNIQAKMAEAHFLIIEEIKRMGSDGSEEGPMPKPTEDLSEMVDWSQATEAPSRMTPPSPSWRVPGTKDIGQKVRCSLWLGVPPEDMREGILMDIRQDDRGRNEYLVKHPPNNNYRGFQQWWPVAWSRVSENPPADVIHIELVPCPEITDIAQVILRDGEAFIDPARVDSRPWPKGLGPDWRFLENNEVFQPGDMITACGDSAGWIPATEWSGRRVSVWTEQGAGSPANECHAARLKDEEARPKPIPENLKDGLVGARAPGYITPDHRHVGQMVEVSDDLFSWYPRKLLAVMALGGGFIVHALGEEAGVGMKKLHARVKA